MADNVFKVGMLLVLVFAIGWGAGYRHAESGCVAEIKSFTDAAEKAAKQKYPDAIVTGKCGVANTGDGNNISADCK